MGPQPEGAGVRIDELQREVETGTIDTVLLVMTDMQGRLMGKRMHAPFFLSDIAAHGAEGCNYLLAVDIEMNTVGGYTMMRVDGKNPDLTGYSPCRKQCADRDYRGCHRRQSGGGGGARGVHDLADRGSATPQPRIAKTYLAGLLEPVAAFRSLSPVTLFFSVFA